MVTGVLPRTVLKCGYSNQAFSLVLNSAVIWLAIFHLTQNKREQVLNLHAL